MLLDVRNAIISDQLGIQFCSKESEFLDISAISTRKKMSQAFEAG
jgi:hypothetical protein